MYTLFQCKAKKIAMAASQQEKGVGIRKKKTLREEKRKRQWGTSWGEKKKIRLHIYNISQFPRAN